MIARKIKVKYDYNYRTKEYCLDIKSQLFYKKGFTYTTSSVQ